MRLFFRFEALVDTTTLSQTLCTSILSLKKSPPPSDVTSCSASFPSPKSPSLPLQSLNLTPEALAASHCALQLELLTIIYSGEYRLRIATFGRHLKSKAAMKRSSESCAACYDFAGLKTHESRLRFFHADDILFTLNPQSNKSVSSFLGRQQSNVKRLSKVEPCT